MIQNTPYFFEYDSVISLEGVSKKDLKKINRYLQSDFIDFINTNAQTEITYNVQTDIEDSELYMQQRVFITHYTSTYINIRKVKSWCCRRNGMTGYESQPSYTIAIKTLKPIVLDTIFFEGFKEKLITRIREHPSLKNLEEDGEVIHQYICEDEKKDYLIQKVKNATTTQEISLGANGIYLNTHEVTHCSELEKYNPDYNALLIEIPFSELRKHIKSNSYISDKK